MINPQFVNLQKRLGTQIANPQSLHLRKVRKSHKLFQSAMLRICGLRNLFSERWSFNTGD